MYAGDFGLRTLIHDLLAKAISALPSEEDIAEAREHVR
jgi:hypothetical protein